MYSLPTSIMTTCAHSSGVPKRPSGMRAADEATAPTMSVWISDGATAFTVMPSFTSRAA